MEVGSIGKAGTNVLSTVMDTEIERPVGVGADGQMDGPFDGEGLEVHPREDD